jgi:hypothetical protein
MSTIHVELPEAEHALLLAAAHARDVDLATYLRELVADETQRLRARQAYELRFSDEQRQIVGTITRDPWVEPVVALRLPAAIAAQDAAIYEAYCLVERNRAGDLEQAIQVLRAAFASVEARPVA